MKNYTKYWQNLVTIVMVGGWMLFPVTASAAGEIVYEQAPGHFGAFLSDGVVFAVADEFQLDESTLVSNITWWGGYGSAAPSPEDSFTVRLFADNGGQPGTLLQTFDVGSIASRTATGDWINPPDPAGGFPGDPEYKYSFDLPTAFSAEAGSLYWLSIVNAHPDGWTWEVSGSPVNLGVQRSFEGGPWEPYFDNTAFQLQIAAAPFEGYEQLPGHFGGFSSDGTVMIVADEFQFEEATLIDNVTWWGGYGYASSLPVDNFTVQLFADNGGEPGALLQSFAVGNTALRTATGDWVNPPDPFGFEGRPEFEYSFNLPTAFPAEANTFYWLAITNVPDSDMWVWEVSGSPVNLGVQRSFEGGPWEPYFDNTAFRLRAAEEPPSPVVEIDIKPYNPYNKIRLSIMGTVHVAILSSSTFDAPSQVDQNSLTFGRTGDEPSLAGCSYYPRDVNGDGLLDLVCRFRTQATGFQIGDTVGILKGVTIESGSLFSGTDSVLIVP